jgi:hypothetical protein
VLAHPRCKFLHLCQIKKRCGGIYSIEYEANLFNRFTCAHARARTHTHTHTHTHKHTHRYFTQDLCFDFFRLYGRGCHELLGIRQVFADIYFMRNAVFLLLSGKRRSTHTHTHTHLTRSTLIPNCIIGSLFKIQV